MRTKAPSFNGLAPASMASARAKRGNRCVDTQHEVLLRRVLWRMGLRFRKNVTALPGKPDIIFSGSRVAVFCDGDFWHGRNWDVLRSRLRKGTNADYWSAKIASNIKRDNHNTGLLTTAGWHVIRLWETDIKEDPTTAAALVEKAVHSRRLASNAGLRGRG